MQFFGRGNAGRLAQGGTGPTKVLLAGYVEEASHAKGVSDGLASEIKNKVTNLFKSRNAVQPGTRNHVLMLAQEYPEPQKGYKTGVWSPLRIFYAYYSQTVLAPGANDDFVAYKDSKQFHFRLGFNTIPAQAIKGNLIVRKGFCACTSCHAPKFDFENCKFHALVGRRMYVV